MFVSGCVTHRNIMPSSQYPTDYVHGGIYQFKEELVAFVDRPLLGRLETFHPIAIGNYYPRPSDLKTNPQDFPQNHALVPAGTRIRIEQFELERNPVAGPNVWISGRVLNGPLIGNRMMVSLISQDAGRSQLDAGLLMVNTNLLYRLEDPLH